MRQLKHVQVFLENFASKRTKERFARFDRQMHRIEFIKTKINESLKGDGFVLGEPMTYFGIDIFKAENNLWARVWEGWIPNKEIVIYEE